MAQVAVAQVGAAEIGAGEIAAVKAAGAEIGLAHHGAIEAGEAEIGTLQIRPAQIGQLIESGAEIGLHQTGASPDAFGRQHALQTGTVELRFAEVGGLEAAAGKIRLLPAGGAGPQPGEIGPPDQRPLKAAAADIGAAQPGMAEASLREAAVTQVAVAQIEVDAIDTLQRQAGEMATTDGEGVPQGLQGGRSWAGADLAVGGEAATAAIGFSHGAMLGPTGIFARRRESERGGQGIELLAAGRQQQALSLGEQGEDGGIVHFVKHQGALRAS